MSRIHVFTSAAGNYLPKVKVLFDSLAVHHPEWQRHLLLVEDWPEEQCEGVALDGRTTSAALIWIYPTGARGRSVTRWLSCARQ
jgi:hypothetical protein